MRTNRNYGLLLVIFVIGARVYLDLLGIEDLFAGFINEFRMTLMRHARVCLPLVGRLAQFTAGDLSDANLRHELILKSVKTAIVSCVFDGFAITFSILIQIRRQALIFQTFVGRRILTNKKTFHWQIWLISAHCMVLGMSE